MSGSLGWLALAWGGALATSGACAPREETTPRGYVVSSSVPADGGPVGDGAPDYARREAKIAAAPAGSGAADGGENAGAR